MDRSFFFGILFGIGFICLVALTPKQNRYGSSDQINNEMFNIFSNLQGKQHEIRTSTPTTRSLQEGEFVLLNNNGLISLYTRVDNTLYTTYLVTR